MEAEIAEGKRGQEIGKGKTVCVTGAGGYIASWLVKLLLSHGYTVHGTVRNTSDEKNAHLKSLENASENLKLFKADLLNIDALAVAIKGCQGVFHVASPVPSENVVDPQLDILGPAVEGTVNVLKTCSIQNVQRVVLVSSMVSVEINPNWPKDKIKDESCWSDKEFCRRNEDWYSLGKTTAEEAALEYGKRTGLDVITVNPALVFGPLLQPTINASSSFLTYILKGGPDPMRNKLWHIVDVRDTAAALLLVYEAPEASGRYICAPHFISTRDLVDLLKTMYPEYPYISKDAITDMEHAAPMTSEKLMKLGWSYRTLRQTLTDTVEFCQKSGYLDGGSYRLPPVYNKI